MRFVLRGHHLLCVHGFRGMGYSRAFVEEMKSIVEQIRNSEIDFPIQVVAGFDQACMACPNRGETKCEASKDANEHVLSMDRKVIQRLGLTEGETYMKSDLVRRTSEKVTPDDLDDLCKSCSWLPYGVCKDGIQALNERK